MGASRLEAAASRLSSVEQPVGWKGPRSSWATRMEPRCSGSRTSRRSPSPAGWTPPKEFREMVEKTMPKSDASKMEKHVFRIYDSNNDGYIDFVEFMLIFHIMSDGTPEEVLEKIFRVFDVNSDGTINKKEMQRLIKDMYGLIKADDPEAESKDLIAKSAFAEMDKDADGKITCSEFTTACLSQEKISKMLALKVIDIFVEED